MAASFLVVYGAHPYLKERTSGLESEYFKSRSLPWQCGGREANPYLVLPVLLHAGSCVADGSSFDVLLSRHGHGFSYGPLHVRPSDAHLAARRHDAAWGVPKMRLLQHDTPVFFSLKQTRNPRHDAGRLRSSRPRCHRRCRSSLATEGSVRPSRPKALLGQGKALVA